MLKYVPGLDYTFTFTTGGKKSRSYIQMPLILHTNEKKKRQHYKLQMFI